MQHIIQGIALQDKMNSKINPEWRTAGYEYLRAVVVEGAEALEHWGWKWWKKQETDQGQFNVEIVDIWHFILSEAIKHHGNEGALAFLIAPLCAQTVIPDPYSPQEGYAIYSEHMTAQRRLDLLIGMSAMRAPLSYVVSVFKAIQILDAKMSDEELLQGYVSKNVLNFFRQDHGYKAGTYFKNWSLEVGKEVEDNVVMASLATELLAGNDFNADTLYAALAAHYVQVVAFNTKSDDNEAAPDNSYALKA